jgi:hypothetical protein
MSSTFSFIRLALLGQIFRARRMNNVKLPSDTVIRHLRLGKGNVKILNPEVEARKARIL